MARISPVLAFVLVSFTLGQVGDGLNIFQGIYLVGIGWNESSIGVALSLMGFTALCVQTFAGDVIDKTKIDRRIFLQVAAGVTACSAMAIMLVREGNNDHWLMYITKVIEGIASSFIMPCLTALTLASFGPDNFDKVMASNILWGHVGSVLSALLAGVLGYVLYPKIKMCFLVIGIAALIAVVFVGFLPQGDPLVGRGFHHQTKKGKSGTDKAAATPKAASYLQVFSDRKTFVLCITGFFFHFANANVLLVLGELMGEAGENNQDGSSNRSAIPLIAGAIVIAQLTMSAATIIGDKLTEGGWGRKILFMIGLITLPLRCALIILWRDASEAYLLSTQVLDGIGGGLLGLIFPYLVADITFGSGRFNVVMGLTSSCFGLGATLSNLLGQIIVEHFGHVTSLMGSLILSVVPVLVFGAFMPETYGERGKGKVESPNETKQVDEAYVQMT